jgi:mannose-6-phosphate isomerase
MSTGLYPLKFTPILKEKIWGGQKISTILNKPKEKLPNIGESWEISCIQGDMSVAANGFLAGNTLQELIEVYMGDLVGEEVYEKFGFEFPLLIKFIDAQDVLSIQVHPDDIVAGERHQAYGKTEMWYVVDNEEGAELISGFKQDCNKQEYLTALQSGRLEELLNFEKVKPGDVFFIPAGRVHAIGSGILLAEIQQTSDITYRIYDWGRVDDNGNPRELHTDLASDVINFKAEKDYKTSYELAENKTVNLVECNYFKTNILNFKGTVEKDYILIDSFVIYMCIEGEFYIHSDENVVEKVKKGETVLIPAVIKNLELKADKQTKLLEVYVSNKN